MKKIFLDVIKRQETGRSVKKLRRQGIIPSTVYGKGIKSASIQIEANKFQEVFEQSGETGIVEIKVDNEIKPTLIHNVQIHPVTREILHVEFRQVDLKEKVTAKVPVEITGIAEAVTQRRGLLIQMLNELDVESLPADLPDKISIDVSKLSQVDDAIKVSDLKGITNTEVLADKEEVIVKIAPLPVEEKSEPVVAAPLGTETAGEENKENESAPKNEADFSKTQDKKE
jgi:large subunit ribosomal protein L25